jgi:hypothetical protein
VTGQICQRITTPQVKRLGQQAHCALPIGRSGAGFVDEIAEAEHVDLIPLGYEHVTGRSRLNPGSAEHFAQSRYVGEQGGAGRIRWLVAPDLIDEAISRDDPVGFEEEEG